MAIGKAAKSPEPKAIYLLNYLRQREAGGAGLVLALCFGWERRGQTPGWSALEYGRGEE